MQSTKQRWDWRIQETLVKEVLRLDPEMNTLKNGVIWKIITVRIFVKGDYYLKHGKSPEENGEHPEGSCI